jgi:hypothetical protein
MLPPFYEFTGCYENETATEDVAPMASENCTLDATFPLSETIMSDDFVKSLVSDGFEKSPRSKRANPQE